MSKYFKTISSFVHVSVTGCLEKIKIFNQHLQCVDPDRIFGPISVIMMRLVESRAEKALRKMGENKERKRRAVIKKAEERRRKIMGEEN